MSDCNLACGDECTKDTCQVFKAYQQGRADAIEEFIKKLDMNLKDDIEAGIIKGFDAGTAMGGALYIAEQMKGK